MQSFIHASTYTMLVKGATDQFNVCLPVHNSWCLCMQREYITNVILPG